MSERIPNTALTIIRSTHASRDAVLFSLVGVASVVYYPSTTDTYLLLMWLIVDLVGLLFLWIPRETLQQVGYGWGGLMSVVLLFPVFYYSGMGHFVGGLIMILFLCIIEILVVLKTGYDILKGQVRSWTTADE